MMVVNFTVGAILASYAFQRFSFSPAGASAMRRLVILPLRFALACCVLVASTFTMTVIWMTVFDIVFD